MNDTEASGEEHGEHGRASVFDFLYHDARRVGSFLAQFDDAGSIRQITHSESVTKGNRRGRKISVGGGVGGVGSAQIGYEIGPAEEGAETSERIYDPLWANALSLLDYLQENRLIVEDTRSARIGQFVLASGDIRIIDLAILGSVWKDEKMQRLIMAQQKPEATQGNRQKHRAQVTTRATAKDPSSDIAFSLLSVLPHSIQAYMHGSVDVWCNLLKSSLVISSDDILLKHGTLIQGTWRILGVLDALPDDQMDSQSVDSPLNNLFGTVLSSMAPVVRTLLGRPPSYYGLTPILVFREVLGADDSNRQTT